MTASNGRVTLSGESDSRVTYEAMRRDIQLGHFGPGDRLIETALAERYSVSRTPIREALRSLQHDGWVVRGERGMQVRGYSIEEIFDLYETREILETAAARAAAERRTEADLALLHEWMSRMERPDLNVEDRVSANRDFHAAIWRASHNSVLTETLDRLYKSSWQYLNSTLIQPARWEASMAEHREIMEAIEAKAPDLVGEVISRHLRAGRDHRAAQHG